MLMRFFLFNMMMSNALLASAIRVSQKLRKGVRKKNEVK